MTKLDHGYVLIAFLGLGAADLGALNLWALPGLFTVTEADAASDTLQPPAAAHNIPTPVTEPIPEESATIQFGRGSWSVGRRGRATLRDMIASGYRERVLVEIDGHADAAGPADLNQRISEQRAQAVAALFLRAGVAADQIQVRAFGEQNPSQDGRSRRVEIRIRGAR
jgi:OmpA-OmpF porin, OOP family